MQLYARKTRHGGPDVDELGQVVGHARDAAEPRCADHHGDARRVLVQRALAPEVVLAELQQASERLPQAAKWDKQRAHMQAVVRGDGNNSVVGKAKLVVKNVDDVLEKVVDKRDSSIVCSSSRYTGV